MSGMRTKMLISLINKIIDEKLKKVLPILVEKRVKEILPEIISDLMSNDIMDDDDIIYKSSKKNTITTKTTPPLVDNLNQSKKKTELPESLKMISKSPFAEIYKESYESILKGDGLSLTEGVDMRDFAGIPKDEIANQLNDDETLEYIKQNDYLLKKEPGLANKMMRDYSSIINKIK